MQSLCGKLRLATKQTANNLKNVQLKQLASFEWRFEGNSIDQPNSRFHSHLDTCSAFCFNKNYDAKIVSPASFTNDGVASKMLSCRSLSSVSNHPSCMGFAFQSRYITTTVTASQDASVSTSSDVPQRIKFKRLDKTARHIMQIIDKEAVEEVKANREIPDIRPGYIIQLRVEVPENKRRVSTIKGIVIARNNAGLNTTFRLRRLVAGVGIESLFPLYSPNIKEIKVLEKKKVRRAKLYYLRDKMNALKKH